MTNPSNTPLATIREIYRYPVKSFAGETLTESAVGWHGLDGDRRFAFVKSESKSGFPWLTGREVPTLLTYAPYFVDTTQIEKSAIRVRTPNGADLPLDSAELNDELTALYTHPIYLLHDSNGLFDETDISLLSTASVAQITAQVSAQPDSAIQDDLDPRRFRPNLLLDLLDQSPFAEDEWVGKRIICGNHADAVHIRVISRDPRCMMIGLDPVTTERNPNVLKTVVETRDKCLGIYGKIERPGVLRVGDVLYLEG